jgi:L-aspartate oxidase
VKDYDFLVIGSGIAGLSFAIKASRLGRVAIITKKGRSDSNTNYAQGGIASVIDPKDNFASHIQDTLVAGAGLCNLDAVDLTITKGPDCIKELMRWGINFTRKRGGTLELGREGGHSHNRIVHVRDYTGAEVEKNLLEYAKHRKNIDFYENHFCIDLITEHNLRPGKRSPTVPTCFGVYVYCESKKNIIPFTSRFTMLCTGGMGQVYLHTSNPVIATGDGVAMAYRAGAGVANLEFMQFHPTTLYGSKLEGRAFLISEALRGAGAELKGSDGQPFMNRYHALASLAPRDIVARAIDNEMKMNAWNHVLLDISNKSRPFLKKHFPLIFSECLKTGIDISETPIPVVPAAHYMCGGIRVDLNGRTLIKNLYASGEVACTGLHGANRLASNSLLEALVFSDQAYSHIKSLYGRSKGPLKMVPPWDDRGTMDNEEWVVISHDREEIRKLMWDYVGIVRSNHRLHKALTRVNLIRSEIEAFYKRTKVIPEIIELRNMALSAYVIIKCALKRKESRGLHYNTNYHPPEQNKFLKDTVL